LNPTILGGSSLSIVTLSRGNLHRVHHAPDLRSSTWGSKNFVTPPCVMFISFDLDECVISLCLLTSYYLLREP